MKEYDRLVDRGANEFERRLLRSADGDEPEDRAQRRLLTALGVAAVTTATVESGAAASVAAGGVGVGVGGGGGVTVASTGAALVVVKWGALALLAGAATVAALRFVSPLGEPATVSPVVSSTRIPTGVVPRGFDVPPPLSPQRGSRQNGSAQGGEVEPSRVQPSERQTGIPHREAPDPLNESASHAVPPPRSASPTAPTTAAIPPAPFENSEPESVSSAMSTAPEAPMAPMPPQPIASLTAEVRAIDRARSSLRDQRPQDALRALDTYASTFPNGTFEPEATALRVEALIAAGDRVAADRLGQAFLLAHPSSPVARQVHTLLNR